MTQTGLAEHLGVNRGALRTWESGRYIPSETETQKKLLEWLAEDAPTHSISLASVNRNLVRNERLRRGTTQRELADRLGFHQRSLHDWERGNSYPQHSHLKALRDWLEEDDIAAQAPLTEWLDSDFGERLRERRHEWEMSEDELAEYLGVKKRTLRAWESGTCLPDVTRTKRLWEWLTEAPSINSVSIDVIDGDLIRRERVRRGMFQVELANRLGVSKGSIIAWELSHRVPRHSNLRALREWLAEEDIKLPASQYPLTELLAPDLGARIRDRRREWAMSRTELAELLGVDRGTLTKWENGMHIPSDVKAQRLLEWLAEDIPDQAIRIEELDGNLMKNV